MQNKKPDDNNKTFFKSRFLGLELQIKWFKKKKHALHDGALTLVHTLSPSSLPLPQSYVYTGFLPFTRVSDSVDLWSDIGSFAFPVHSQVMVLRKHRGRPLQSPLKERRYFAKTSEPYAETGRAGTEA